MSARRGIDVALGLLALVFGLASLSYPYGRDQGLYYYVAREWVLHGSVPYRDVLDHKTPGIYLLYGLSVRLFGEQMWGVRVFDLAGVALVGFLAATLAKRSGRPNVGAYGAAWLGASVLYYGYLNFWNTAQSELWYAILALVAVVAADRIPRIRVASAVAGLFAGAAFIMKPPAVWLVMVAAFWLAQRVWDRSASTRLARARPALVPLVVFGAFAALVPIMIVGYFAAKGALPAMIDIVVGANGYYVKHEKTTSGPRDIAVTIGLYHWCYLPLVPAIVLYLGIALWRAKGETAKRLALASLLVGAAYAAVIMQGKYYLLHWTVAIPAYTVVLANAFLALDDWLGSWRAPLAFVTALGVLYAGALFTWRGPEMWFKGAMNAYLWQTHAEARAAFLDRFQEPSIGFWYTQSDQVGRWLADHTTPDDIVTVRGFQPEIYAIAGRHHAGRFFWTTFLTQPGRAYHRAEWLAEDLDAIVRAKPKYIVALTAMTHGPDSPSYFLPLGYRTVEVIAEFTIMARPDESPAPR